MNHSLASGSPLIITLGEAKRTLRRLTRRDYSTLIERMPVADEKERKFLSPFDVHRWSATVEGAAVVIAVSSLEAGYSADALQLRIAEVSAEDGAWGSITRQAVVAPLISAESLTAGDEEPAPEGEKRSDPTSTGATTTTKRA